LNFVARGGGSKSIGKLVGKDRTAGSGLKPYAGLCGRVCVFG